MSAPAEDAAAPTRHLRWRPTPNPVLRRELIERWRGRRAFVVLTVYLGVLTGMMLLLLWAGSKAIESGLEAGPSLGRFLLENVLGLVLLLVLFVGPGYAAAQIAQERERRTLGLLQITLVTPWRIVTGKLGAASAWLLLLVVTAAPMAATAFFLGGVSVGDLLRGVAYVVIVTVSVAAAGVGISAMVRRTVAAVVLTYGLVLLLVGGTVFGGIIEAVIREDRPVLLTANPFFGLADATRATTDFNGSQLPSILTPFAYALPEENTGRGIFGGDDVAQPVFDAGPDRQPVWLRTLAIHVALGALGLLVAARRVRPGHGPRPRRRPRDRTIPRTLEAPDVAIAPATVAAPPPAPPPPPPPDGRLS